MDSKDSKYNDIVKVFRQIKNLILCRYYLYIGKGSLTFPFFLVILSSSLVSFPNGMPGTVLAT